MASRKKHIQSLAAQIEQAEYAQGVGGHDPTFAKAYDRAKADVSVFRRHKFALENPERVVTWVGGHPVLSDDDEAFLLLKHEGYCPMAKRET